MKRFSMLLAAGFAALAFAGCTSAPTTAATSAQALTITAKVQSDVRDGCLILSPIASALTSTGGLTGGALKSAQTANTDFQAVCAANTTLTVANLTELVNTGVPALNTAIQASTASQTVKSVAALALPALQLALAAFAVASSPAAAPTAPASAASATIVA
jgi:hypothetical protein